MKFNEVYLNNTGSDSFGDIEPGSTGDFTKTVLPKKEFLNKDGKINRRKFYKYYKKWHKEHEKDRSFQYLTNHDKESNL